MASGHCQAATRQHHWRRWGRMFRRGGLRGEPPARRAHRSLVTGPWSLATSPILTLSLVWRILRSDGEAGGMAEWSKATVLKTVRGFTAPRGFESYSLRQVADCTGVRWGKGNNGKEHLRCRSRGGEKMLTGLLDRLDCPAARRPPLSCASCYPVKRPPTALVQDGEEGTMGEWEGMLAPPLPRR